MTSNIGSNYLLDGITRDGKIDERTRLKIMDEMKSHFRPEFLNRIDEVVLFKPLAKEEIKRIVDLTLIEIRKRLSDQHIEIELSAEARDYIAEKSYDPIYGARPLKRFLQRELETRLAKALIKNEISENDRVLVDIQGGVLIIRKNNQILRV